MTCTTSEILWTKTYDIQRDMHFFFSKSCLHKTGFWRETDHEVYITFDTLPITEIVTFI